MFWRRRNDEHPAPGDHTSAEDRTLEQLSAYLDGELTEAEMAEVDALIERDDVAAEVLNDLDLVRSAFGALGEVRAPRSFAIPADAATSPARVAAASYTTSGPVALFRRTEMFMRASAAVAALFFVVAVVNNPSGGTPVGTFEAEAQTSMLAAESTGSGPALEPMQATGEAAGEDVGEAGAATLAVPVPEDADATTSDGGEAPAPGGNVPVPADGAGGAGDAGGGASGGMAAGSSEAAGTLADDTPGVGENGDVLRSAEGFQPPPAGTELIVDSSQDAGGMAYGLGALAALLTALSALTAWSRRSDRQPR